MSTRTTIEQVHGAAARVNAQLRRKSSTARVAPQGRNGYTALDLYDDRGRMIDTIYSGTKLECWRHLHGMARALDLLDPPHTAEPEPEPDQDGSTS